MKTKFSGILTLLLAFVVHISFAQTKTVSGTVSDASGPLLGVSVFVKGTTKGTETDFDGKYSIKVKSGDVLAFSYIGYKTAEKTVGGSNTINVVMTEDSNVLDEVVVTAVGVSRTKKAAGFSSQDVKGDDISKTAQTDISTSLAGRVAGVQFTGQPSSTFNNSNIRLRGNTGVLYVVDGVKVGARSDFNPADIEDINILKGLSATALYGPSGKNGVIVITTKKAKSGESTITLNSNLLFENIYILPEYQNEYGGGYNTYRNLPEDTFRTYGGEKILEYYADESWGPKIDGTPIRHWDSWIVGDSEYGKLRPYSANPNNIRDFYRTGFTQNINLTLAKGGEDYSIRTSLSTIKRTAPFPNAERETLQLGLNASYDLNDSWKMYGNINYQNRFTFNNPGAGYGNLNSNFNQWWQRQLDMKRLRRYRRDGKIVSWNINGPTNTKPLYWDSPYFQVYENIGHQYKDAVFGKVGVNYKVNDDLDLSLELRNSYNNYKSDGRTAFGGLSTTGYALSHSRSRNTVLYGISNYNKTFDKFDLTLNLGFELENSKSTSFSGSSNGGLAIKNFYHITNSIDRPTTNEGESVRKNKAAFLRASLGYDNFAFIEGSLRRDWSSTARPDDNSVTTYGISGSLIVSELFENKDVISFAKLRAGYASAPAFPGLYQLNDSYRLSGFYGSNGVQYFPNTAPNPNLIGGVRSEFEAGGEIKFLSNRVGIDVTYFKKTDTDLPVSVRFDGSTGYTRQIVNSGKQTYKGIEVVLSGTPVKNENFRWDMNLNFATLDRFVDDLYTAPNGQKLQNNILSASWRGLQLRAEKGKPWGAIYGRKIRKDANGNTVFSANGRATLQFDSNEYLGNVLPDFTGGFSNNFTYKNLDLSFSIDFQKGGKFFSVTDMFNHYSGLSINTIGKNKLGNSVRAPVTGGAYTRFAPEATAGPDTGGYYISGVDTNGNPISGYRNAVRYWNTDRFALHEQWLYDASYVKLRTVRLGYTLPKSITSKTPFSNINMGVYGNNVWLIYSTIKGIDTSELEGQGGVNWIEGGQSPSSRSYGFNVLLTF